VRDTQGDNYCHGVGGGRAFEGREGREGGREGGRRVGASAPEFKGREKERRGGGREGEERTRAHIFTHTISQEAAAKKEEAKRRFLVDKDYGAALKV